MIFTVFTPTFNRAHTLHRVYDSLCKQSLRDFEWVIVDDGSDDNTRQIVDGWISEGRFPIQYKFQTNCGKHVAVNQGVRLASGELFLIADSDDEFPANALELMYDHWCAIPDKERSKFTGVTGLCANEQGQIIGDKFPADVFDSNSADIYYRYGVRGEKWGFHRTDVLKAFPFPEPEDKHFVPEGLIWNTIGRHYKTRFVNVVVRYYFQDSGNQLTSRSPMAISPVRIFYAMSLDDDIDYFTVAPLKMCKIAAQGSRFSLHQRDSFRIQISRLTKWRSRLIWALAMPVGIFLFFADILRFGRGNNDVNR